jgi:hypothetical protein
MPEMNVIVEKDQGVFLLFVLRGGSSEKFPQS